MEDAKKCIEKSLKPINDLINGEVKVDVDSLNFKIKNIEEKITFKKEKTFNYSKKFGDEFNLIPGINFAFSIEPSFSFEVGVELAMELKEDEISLYIDAYAQVEAKISFELALVFPPGEKHLRELLGMPTISVGIGIEGQLVSIKVGLKLSLILSDIKFEIDLYTEINAFSLSFYCLFKFEIEIAFLNTEFKIELYLFKFEFKGISLEIHIKKPFKCIS